MAGRIIHGDALAELKRLPAASIDLVMTSPPYADARKRQYGGPSPDKYVAWYLPIAREIRRVLKPTGSYILNIKEGRTPDGQRSLYVYDLVGAHVREAGLRWHDTFIWHKPNPFPGNKGSHLPDAWEPCYQFTRGPTPQIDKDANRRPIAAETAAKREYMKRLDADPNKEQRAPGHFKNQHDNKEFIAPNCNRIDSPTAQAHNHIEIEAIEEPYIDKSQNRRPISPSTATKRAYVARLDAEGTLAERAPSLTRNAHGSGMGTGTGALRIDDPTAQAHNHVTIGVLAGAGRAIKHPAMYPEKLPAWFIRLLCPAAGIVLDPFAGACTTAWAAEQLGRRWIMIEKERKYVEAARARLAVQHEPLTPGALPGQKNPKAQSPIPRRGGRP